MRTLHLGVPLSLNGWPLLYLLLAVAAVPVLGTIRSSSLVFKSSAGVLAGTLIFAQVATVLAFGVFINDRYSFYTSWSDLLGQAHSDRSATQLTPGSLDLQAADRAARALAGHGAILRESVVDNINRASTTVTIYIPAAYSTMPRNTLFPVIEIVGGAANQVSLHHLVSTLDSEISRGRISPMVAVMTKVPSARAAPGSCGDPGAGGPIEALLGSVLHDQLASQLRIRSDPHGWALMGYSQGVSCSIGLALGRTSLYSAVVIVDGNVPAWKSVIALPLRMLLHRRLRPSIGPPAVPHTMRLDAPLLLVSDNLSAREAAESFVVTAPGDTPSHIELLDLTSSGVNSWKSRLSACFTWVASQTSGPLVPGTQEQVTVVPAKDV